MPSHNQNVDESQIKEKYKERIRGYLPETWGKHEVNQFINALFEGLVSVPGSKYKRILLELRQKGLFRWVPVYDEKGNRVIGQKYFPNTDIIKTKAQKRIEELQEKYQNI